MQNLHPLFVHFPLALLSVGLLTDLVAVVRDSDWMRRAGLWLQAVGLVGAATAVASGLLAERTVGHVDAAHEVIERHELLAFATFGLFAVLLVWRLWRRPLVAGKTTATVAYFCVAALALGSLVATGWLGGELVYEYGVGTRATADIEGGHGHDEGDGAHDDGAGSAESDADSFGEEAGAGFDSSAEPDVDASSQDAQDGRGGSVGDSGDEAHDDGDAHGDDVGDGEDAHDDGDDMHGDGDDMHGDGDDHGQDAGDDDHQDGDDGH